MRINKSNVDAAEKPIGKNQVFYRDQELKGFALRVTSTGSKSFVVETLINNKGRRMTLGKYGKLTADQARTEAKKLLGKIAGGSDPIAEKHAAKISKVTLKEVFEDYLKARKSLKPKTKLDYERVLNIAFANWHNKALTSITKDKVTKLHETLGKERGEAYANLAMRILRALFNFAAGQYEDSQGRSIITENPVKRLSQTRAWYRIERRQTFIKSHELFAWYQGVKQLANEILRDYLLLILFTGLRRQEAAKLRWDQLDFKARSLTITDTKNHETHTLPLSDYLYDLLLNRKQHSTSNFVFPGTGTGGYIVEPRKQIAKVIASSGTYFTVHDLRRTFITTAESLDIPAYALKRLMNHKMNDDITAGYIIADVERLRKPMQQITDYLLKCMEVIQENNVILLKQENS